MNTNNNPSCYRGQGSSSPCRSTQDNGMQNNCMRNDSHARMHQNMNSNMQGRSNQYMNSNMQGRSNQYMSGNMSNRMEQRSGNSTCSKEKFDPCGISGTNRIDEFPVGMAYVPWQEFKCLYDPHQGLSRGTLFQDLDYPFYGKRGNY